MLSDWTQRHSTGDLQQEDNGLIKGGAEGHWSDWCLWKAQQEATGTRKPTSNVEQSL